MTMASGVTKRLIDQHRAELIHHMRCQHVVRLLCRHGYLTDVQQDDITTRPSQQEQNETLLDYLISEQACQCFYNALAETGQHALLQGIGHSKLNFCVGDGPRLYGCLPDTQSVSQQVGQ